MWPWLQKLKSGCTIVLVAMLSGAHAQNLVINELMTSNDFAHPDAFFEFDDCEIYTLGGLWIWRPPLSDDPTNLTKYTIPDTDPGTTFLTENGHMVVWLDQDSAQGVLHAISS